MAVISTAPLHGYSVIFSPFTPDKIAFAGADNYGIAGGGALVVYQQLRDGSFTAFRRSTAHVMVLLLSSGALTQVRVEGWTV